MRTKSLHVSNKALRLMDVAVELMEQDKGVWPTVRQLARAAGYVSTNTVAFHLRSLVEANLIERNPCIRYGLYRPVERTQQ